MPNWQENNQVKWLGVKPARQGTQFAELKSANNGAIAFTAVPAGQILYLCTAHLNVGTNVSGVGSLYIRTGGGVLWFYLGLIRMIANNPCACRNITFWPPLEVPATYYGEVASDTLGCIAYADLFGWVE